MSLAAVDQICVIHEAMNGCKKSKDLLKACFKYVNIYLCFYLQFTDSEGMEQSLDK